jgi:DNA-binding Lrp family transcriptional regulator
MDSKDFQLLVELHQNARQSYQSLGRRVSLSAPAVNERLKRLSSRGILQGFWLTPDPGVFDREDLMVFFDGTWTHHDVEKALGVSDVAWVALKVDGGLTVEIWPHTPEQGLKNLVNALRTKPSGTALGERRHFHSLSIIDWQVMDALLDNPRMPLNELSDATGLGRKTVAKHLEIMIEDKIIFITPNLGALADSGELVYHLIVNGNIGMDVLNPIIGDAYLVNSLEPSSKYLLCRSKNLDDLTTVTGQIGRLQGVESVSVTSNRERPVNFKFMHSLIGEQIRNLEKERIS